MTKFFLLTGLVFTVFITHAQRRDTTITITTSANLQFDQKRLVIKPNTRLRLTFQNKDDMAHNLVVTRPNSRLRVVEFALALGDKGPELHHVPVMDEVLAHTVSVEPGNLDSLAVTLAEGAYPFVCTYPGHGSIMYGIIYATNEPKRLPNPDEDLNIPNPNRLAGADHQHQSATAAPQVHPYRLTLPAVYRTFMPDCGPAAIAVGLPGPDGGQSYVFDAGQCRLRYAWSGGFVDNTQQWDGKGQRLTKVVGEIYFRDTGGFPWRIGQAGGSVPQFKGYRLVNRYPEFRYVVDGVDVRELIKPLSTGTGLVRTFTIAPTKQTVVFLAANQPGLQLKSSVGAIKNGELRLPPGTRQFTLTVSK